MDHLSFAKFIDGYLDRDLADADLNDFLRHLEECPDCAEELEISFIVKEGIGLLDKEQKSYDLSAALSADIMKNRRHLRMKKILIRLSYIVSSAVMWAVLCALVVYIRVSLFL